MSLFKSIASIATAPISMVTGTLFGGKDRLGALGTGRPDVRGSIFEQNQANLINLLEQRARGEGQSLAALQAQEAQERGLAQTMSAIQSVPGLSAALRARLAQQAQQESASDLARQEQVGRLAEQEGAQQALIQALASARGQDISQEQMRVGAFEKAGERRSKLAQEMISGAANVIGAKAKPGMG